jgi:hypothetical protein
VKLGFRQGFIGAGQLRALAKALKNEYGVYLEAVADEAQ